MEDEFLFSDDESIVIINEDLLPYDGESMVDYVKRVDLDSQETIFSYITCYFPTESIVELANMGMLKDNVPFEGMASAILQGDEKRLNFFLDQFSIPQLHKTLKILRMFIKNVKSNWTLSEDTRKFIDKTSLIIERRIKMLLIEIIKPYHNIRLFV